MTTLDTKKSISINKLFIGYTETIEKNNNNNYICNGDKGTVKKEYYPNFLVGITNEDYQQAFNFINNGKACLEVLKNINRIDFKEGKMLIAGTNKECISSDIYNLQDNNTSDIDCINIRGLFSIIYNVWEKKYNKDGLPQFIVLRQRDLLNFRTEKDHFNKSDIKALYKKLTSYVNITGVFTDGQDKKYYPLFVPEYLDETNKIIKFRSPYFFELLKRLNNLDKLCFMYLEKPSLLRRKDKAAIENVSIICRIVATCGKGKTANIKIKTLLQENKYFLDKYNKSRNKSVVLSRIMDNTWQYLIEDTFLLKYYPNMIIPNDKISIKMLDSYIIKLNKGKKK